MCGAGLSGDRLGGDEAGLSGDWTGLSGDRLGWDGVGLGGDWLGGEWTGLRGNGLDGAGSASTFSTQMRHTASR